MNSIISRVSYLNGLIDGLGITNETKEGKVIAEIASILRTMAEEIEDLQIAQEETDEYIDAIDEDLNNIEEDFYGEFDDDDDEMEDCCEDYVDITCPNCNETVYIDSDICEEKDAITCPNCHSNIDLDCDCEE